jgi:hypothetical protein
MKPRPDRRRAEPYYKVQYRDPKSVAWKDYRREAFDTAHEAVEFTRTVVTKNAMRVVEFNAGRATTVFEQR